MKGIFNIKNITKFIPKTLSSNLVANKNAQINGFFINADNKIDGKGQMIRDYRNIISNIGLSGLINFSDKLKFSVSKLIFDYFYRLQCSNFQGFKKDASIFILSGDKNNLNENKNINEDDINVKLNGNKDKENDSNGNYITKLKYLFHILKIFNYRNY